MQKFRCKIMHNIYPRNQKLYTLQYTLVCIYIHYTLYAISRPTFCIKIRCKVPHRIRLGRVLCVCRVVRISCSSRIPALRHRDWLPGWFETGEVSPLRAWTVDMLWHHFVAKVSRCQHQNTLTKYTRKLPGLWLLILTMCVPKQNGKNCFFKKKKKKSVIVCIKRGSKASHRLINIRLINNKISSP